MSKLKTDRPAFFSLSPLSDRKVIAICLTLVFIFSCSSNVGTSNSGREAQVEEIKWLDRIDVLYPGQLYLTGLGMGSTKEEADNNAFRNISKSIKIHVKSEEVSREHYRQSDQRDDVSDFQYDDNLRVESETILENARIEKHSYDSSKDMYYSLAVLRKSKYASIISSRIGESRDKSYQILNNIENEDSPVIKLGMMFSLAGQTSLQRRNYEILKVVSDDFERYRPDPDEIEVNKMIDQFLHENFALSIEIEGELSEDITMVLKERFTENGYFITSDHQRQPDILISGSTSIREIRGRDRRLTTVHWSLNLNFIEKKSGNVIYSDTVRDRQMQPTSDMARERIMYHMRKEVADDIIRGFQNKLSGAAENQEL